MTSRRLTPEEARAWARVASTVKPIGPSTDSLEDFAKALQEGEPIMPRRAGKPTGPGPRKSRKPSAPVSKPPGLPANRQGEKRVKRGRLELAGRIDLHGHTQASADSVLTPFLQRSRAENARCVLVITGKGRGGEGVLRRRFLDWVQSPAAGALVSGYSEAHARHGGSGAFYLFLRTSPTHTP